MSKIKRWIEDEMSKGNDVLHPDNQGFDDDYQEDGFGEWCYYSGMTSPHAYDNTEGLDEG